MAEIRECKKHGLTKYHHVKNTNNYRCTKCQSENVQRRRVNLKLMAIAYKGGCCERCGYNKCVTALEFHHLDPSEKDFGISAAGATRSFERIKVELDKCIMVCSNCHKEIHFNENIGV